MRSDPLFRVRYKINADCGAYKIKSKALDAVLIAMPDADIGTQAIYGDECCILCRLIVARH